IIKYTGKSSNQLTGCTRGAFSTTAASHTLDTKVDQVAGWENANPWNMIYGLLVDIVGFSVSDIDVADSESERDIWLSSYSFTGVVISSKNVSDIIKKICEECGAVMWWSNEEQKIKFRVLAPPSPDYYVKTLDDSTGIVSGSYNEENNEDSRKSIVIVNYNKSATDEDYASAIAASEDNKADVTEYGSHAVKSIDAWFITQESVATSLAERWLSQYVIPPRLASMKAELKDDEVKVGDIVEVNTDDILDAFGEQQHIMFRVLKKEKSGANELKFKIMDTYYGNTRYGFIAENTAADYDDATDYEKQFCYICDDDGTINGTDPGYLIIAL
ncbi:MAG: hypothetical protein KAS32_15640, partial [Candidatus Peribacteraceae bacterium]|nr:hypothetical protein [Candidatus Peribacteraceae bacterium]